MFFARDGYLPSINSCSSNAGNTLIEKAADGIAICNFFICSPAALKSPSPARYPDLPRDIIVTGRRVSTSSAPTRRGEYVPVAAQAQKDVKHRQHANVAYGPVIPTGARPASIPPALSLKAYPVRHASRAVLRIEESIALASEHLHHDGDAGVTPARPVLVIRQPACSSSRIFAVDAHPWRRGRDQLFVEPDRLFRDGKSSALLSGNAEGLLPTCCQIFACCWLL